MKSTLFSEELRFGKLMQTPIFPIATLGPPGIESLLISVKYMAEKRLLRLASVVDGSMAEVERMHLP
jgi:hypothetical protein